MRLVYDLTHQQSLPISKICRGLTTLDAILDDPKGRQGDMPEYVPYQVPNYLQVKSRGPALADMHAVAASMPRAEQGDLRSLILWQTELLRTWIQQTEAPPMRHPPVYPVQI